MYFLQTVVLDNARASDPGVWWWIKADGVDVVKGLCESVNGVWSGDVDLNDKKLQELYRDVSERVTFIGKIGIDNRKDVETILSDLKAVLDFTKNDGEFLHNGK